MQGVVFLEFLDMAAGRFGAGVLDRTLEMAGLESGGDYDDAETYDPRELPRLVSALAKQTGRPSVEVMRAFGRHLFTRLLERRPALGADGSAREKWSRLDTMLPPAGPPTRQGSGSGLPGFAQRTTDDGALELRCDVPKALADLADEFLVAAIEGLGPVASKDVGGDGTTVLLRLTIA
jgi:hypothetical protein